MKQYTIKTAGHRVIGALQIVSGILMLGMCGSGLLLRGGWRYFTGETLMMAGGLAGAAAALACWLFYLGFLNFATVKRCKRLVAELAAAEGPVCLSEAAAKVERSKSGFMRDLSRMKAHRYFEGVCVLENCIILENPTFPRVLMIDPDEQRCFEERKKILGSGTVIRTRKVKEQQRAESGKPTGHAAEDMVQEGRRLIFEITEKKGKIANSHIDSCLVEILTAANQMLDLAADKPEKSAAIRQAIEYYLPTISDLLSEYKDLADQRIKGGNILAAMEKIESSMGTAAENFKLELDILYLDRRMDIAVDIEVMENIMKEKRSLLWN